MRIIDEINVKNLLKAKPEIEAEIEVIQAQLAFDASFTDSLANDRVIRLEQQLRLIDSLYVLLSEDEKFIIQRHMIDGLDWPRVIKEYVDKWGIENEKSTRSFQIYQTKGLRKIANVINNRVGAEKFLSVLDERKSAL